jgi:hypothetical protein
MDFRPMHIGKGVIGALLLLLSTTAARADAIDGDWCLGAKTTSIRGPDIVTRAANA